MTDSFAVQRKYLYETLGLLPPDTRPYFAALVNDAYRLVIPLLPKEDMDMHAAFPESPALAELESIFAMFEDESPIEVETLSFHERLVRLGSLIHGFNVAYAKGPGIRLDRYLLDVIEAVDRRVFSLNGGESCVPEEAYAHVLTDKGLGEAKIALLMAKRRELFVTLESIEQNRLTMKLAETGGTEITAGGVRAELEKLDEKTKRTWFANLAALLTLFVRSTKQGGVKKGSSGGINQQRIEAQFDARPNLMNPATFAGLLSFANKLLAANKEKTRISSDDYEDGCRQLEAAWTSGDIPMLVNLTAYLYRGLCLPTESLPGMLLPVLKRLGLYDFENGFRISMVENLFDMDWLGHQIPPESNFDANRCLERIRRALLPEDFSLFGAGLVSAAFLAARMIDSPRLREKYHADYFSDRVKVLESSVQLVKPVFEMAEAFLAEPDPYHGKTFSQFEADDMHAVVGKSALIALEAEKAMKGQEDEDGYKGAMTALRAMLSTFEDCSEADRRQFVRPFESALGSEDLCAMMAGDLLGICPAYGDSEDGPEDGLLN